MYLINLEVILLYPSNFQILQW